MTNLDPEWVELIQEAIQQGLDIEEIKSFLETYSTTNNSN
ncbi:anti-repressor SinI family protein [uncultured Metabacillus sp.]|nr:anti-repressor SinI family protein [uncultured Metabacillus sp.]